MTDEVKAAEGLPAQSGAAGANDNPNASGQVEMPPTAHDRARALVDGYAHALATNSPRTLAELAEIKALFDLE